MRTHRKSNWVEPAILEPGSDGLEHTLPRPLGAPADIAALGCQRAEGKIQPRLRRHRTKGDSGDRGNASMPHGPASFAGERTSDFLRCVRVRSPSWFEPE